MAIIGITTPLFNNFDIEGEKVPVEKQHITMFYLGKDIEKSLLNNIYKCIYNIISNKKIFKVSTNLISNFNIGDMFANIALIYSKELIDLRNEMEIELKQNNIFYDETYLDWKPHITLSFSKEKLQNKIIETKIFNIDKIVVKIENGGKAKYIHLKKE